MASEEIAVKVNNVSKDFKLPHQKKNTIKSVFTGVFSKSKRTVETQHALKGISFEIKKGEFFGIVGRNGSGKSTLLKILAGIYQPTEGNIQVSGKLVPFIELGVGFNPELTGRENVYLNGALLGFDNDQVKKMYNEIVKFAELEKFMDQKLKNYSSGMQVRLAFSMAVRADADILLIDEVLAVGDADFQRKCYEYFKALKRNKKTVVFVSHDMDAVREYCDKAILVDKNVLVYKDEADVIASKYSKLFNTPIQKNEHEKKDDESRWGDRKIVYESVLAAKTEIHPEDKYVTIKTVAKANGKVDDPVFGITIKDLSGAPIFGTNTKIKDVKIARIDPGKRIEIEWKVPNIFNAGTHYICPAIVHSGGYKTSDWWEQAEKIRVVNEERTPYPVNPKISVKVRDV